MMEKRKKKEERKRRVRKTLGEKPGVRLSVFRSSKEIYGQVIDDARGITLASFSSGALKEEEKKGKTKSEVALLVGERLAEVSRKKKVRRVIFDRGPYQYHGRVKALAEGARKGGLVF